MERDSLLDALAELGRRAPMDAEVVIVGGAAAVLCRWIDRATADVDVVASEPKLSRLAPAIAAVAEALGLPERWINDGAKAFAHVLAPDYRERLVEVGTWGRLDVKALGRRDFIVMKLFALRAEDVLDLHELGPTAEEIAFVRAQLPRIAAVDAARAHLMDLYLAQGEDP